MTPVEFNTEREVFVRSLPEEDRRVVIENWSHWRRHADLFASIVWLETGVPNYWSELCRRLGFCCVNRAVDRHYLLALHRLFPVDLKFSTAESRRDLAANMRATIKAAADSKLRAAADAKLRAVIREGR